jgi:hypothetical protein
MAGSKFDEAALEIATVPKVAVAKNSNPGGQDGYVWATGQRSNIYPVAYATGPKSAPQEKFWLCIAFCTARTGRMRSGDGCWR